MSSWIDNSLPKAVNFPISFAKKEQIQEGWYKYIFVSMIFFRKINYDWMKQQIDVWENRTIEKIKILRSWSKGINFLNCQLYKRTCIKWSSYKITRLFFGIINYCKK